MNPVDKLIENEIKFCDENNFEKNESENYIFKSLNGKQSLNLPFILNDYKDWLIENKILKPVKP